MNLENTKIAVIGLGYVGLPLAVAFAKKYSVVGFDIDSKRIESISNRIDSNHEVDLSEVSFSALEITSNPNEILDCSVKIITVPTPIDEQYNPDLKPLIAASEQVAQFLQKGDVVVYESTVYPGCTEEICVPILEKKSNFKFNQDFFVGYSPERINPGDQKYPLTSIVKVTSGSTSEIADFIDQLYGSIITAGTHKAPNIKTAEAAKITENIQRDLNVSLMNELALIFDKLKIDSTEVIDAASTKWNFMPFKPGLVGGHCICVDPYYLLNKAKTVGYMPDVISSGRRVNENMGKFIAQKTIKLLVKNGFAIKNSNVLILGFSFKENCSDFRNTKVIDVYNTLTEFGVNVDVVDPNVDNEKVNKQYGIQLTTISDKTYDAIILAVPHKVFLEWNLYGLKSNEKAILVDVKAALSKDDSDYRL